MKKENIYYALSVFTAVSTVAAAIMFIDAGAQIAWGLIPAVLCGIFFYLGISQTMFRQSQTETQRRELLEHHREALGTAISEIVSLQTSSLLDVYRSLNVPIHSKLDTFISAETNRQEQTEKFRTELFSKFSSIYEENQEMKKILEDASKVLSAMSAASAAFMKEISASTQQQISRIQECSEEIQTVIHKINEQLEKDSKCSDDFYGLVTTQLDILDKKNEEIINYVPLIQSDLKAIFNIIKTSTNKNENLLIEMNDSIQDLESALNTELVQAIERQAGAYRDITEKYENITAQDAKLIEKIFGD